VFNSKQNIGALVAHAHKAIANNCKQASYDGLVLISDDMQLQA
jgi:hypothetical protein